MSPNPPLRSAARVRLELRWAAAFVPPWVAHGVGLLDAAAGLACTLVRGVASNAWQGGADEVSVALCLDLDIACSIDAKVCWLVTDSLGRSLSSDRPLLHPIVSGQGIELLLWQREQVPAQGLQQVEAAATVMDVRWSLRRRLHLAASSRYRDGRSRLPDALCRLVQQACVDHDLASRGLLPSGPAMQAAVDVPQPQGVDSLQAVGPAQMSGLGTLWLFWQGAARAWWKLQRSRWLRESWAIGIVDAPVQHLLQPGSRPPVRWLASPPGVGYWADPMGNGGCKDQIVCEYYDERTGVGHIERLALDEAGHVRGRKRLAVGDGKHASFPLTVQIDGGWYGLAETSANRETVLHRVDAEGQWHPMATLLPGVAAADAALFVWGGYCWLAYTDMDLGETDNLCLQYAQSLDGPWRAHANNPVKVDVTGARMAGGVFVHEGTLYRPAQNCLNTYGGAVVLHRILVCTPTAFEEVSVLQLDPDPKSPFAQGLHTVSAWGQRTLVDGKRHVFSLPTVWRKLVRRFQARHHDKAQAMVKSPR